MAWSNKLIPYTKHVSHDDECLQVNHNNWTYHVLVFVCVWARICVPQMHGLYLKWIAVVQHVFTDCITCTSRISIGVAMVGFWVSQWIELYCFSSDANTMQTIINMRIRIYNFHLRNALILINFSILTLRKSDLNELCLWKFVCRIDAIWFSQNGRSPIFCVDCVQY